MRARPPVAAALAIAGLAVFTVWITWKAKTLEPTLQGNRRGSPLVTKAAPDFTLPALDGRTVSLADYRGKKKVVVTFWASWCGPCRLELPVLRSFYEKTHKPGADYEILAISLDEDPNAAERAAHEGKLPFPVLLDPEQKIAGVYAVEGIPTLLVIDKRGRVAYGSAGFSSGLEYTLAPLLGIDPKIFIPGGSSGIGGH